MLIFPKRLFASIFLEHIKNNQLKVNDCSLLYLDAVFTAVKFSKWRSLQGSPRVPVVLQSRKSLPGDLHEGSPPPSRILAQTRRRSGSAQLSDTIEIRAFVVLIQLHGVVVDSAADVDAMRRESVHYWRRFVLLFGRSHIFALPAMYFCTELRRRTKMLPITKAAFK